MFVVSPWTPQKFNRYSQHQKTKTFRTPRHLLRNRIRLDVYDGEGGYTQDFDLEFEFYAQKEKGGGRLEVHLRKLYHQTEVDCLFVRT